MCIHTKSLCFNHKLFVCLLYETCKVKCHNQKIGVKTRQWSYPLPFSQMAKKLSVPLFASTFIHFLRLIVKLYTLLINISPIFILILSFKKIKDVFCRKKIQFSKIHCRNPQYLDIYSCYLAFKQKFLLKTAGKVSNAHLFFQLPERLRLKASRPAWEHNRALESV